MPAVAFDTHAAIKLLTGAGFDESQAEAITGALSYALSGAITDGGASKADVVRLENRIERTAAELRADLYRALWVQGAGIIAIVAGLLAISRVV